MKALFSKLLVVAMLAGTVTAATPAITYAASAVEVAQDVQTSLSEFRATVPKSASVLDKAAGILVFPNVYKGGIGIGAEYGQGALLVGGKLVDYYDLAAGSIGFQLGGQKKTVIIAFLNQAALNKFRASRKFEVGANASVAVLNVGAEGEINTKDLSNQPIVAFVTDQKGLMYDLTLEGSKITRVKNKR